MRNAVRELVDKIRGNIKDLAFSIWKEWRAEKKRLFAEIQATNKLAKKQVALENKRQKRLKQRTQTLTKLPSRKPSIKPAETSPSDAAGRKYKREHRPRTKKQIIFLSNRDKSKPRLRPTHRDHSKARKRRKAAPKVPQAVGRQFVVPYPKLSTSDSPLPLNNAPATPNSDQIPASGSLL